MIVAYLAEKLCKDFIKKAPNIGQILFVFSILKTYIFWIKEREYTFIVYCQWARDTLNDTTKLKKNMICTKLSSIFL